MTFTIFSIPKPFDGPAALIQENAIASWAAMPSRPEIILFGDDDGVAEAAGQAGAIYCPQVKKNDQGTPLLDSVFEMSKQIASGDTLVYVNADIILTSTLLTAALAVQNRPTSNYVMVGRRVDMDVNERLNFSAADWEINIIREARQKGSVHGYSGIDYMVFPKRFEPSMPAFAVGRPGWDNWLIWRARSSGVPVIDATADVTVIHQNHDYRHSKYGGKKRVGGPETKGNYKLAGGFVRMLNILDANYIIINGQVVKRPWPGGIISALSLFYPWRLFLALKRNLQNLINP